MTIGGIVLGAGSSRRLGRPKQTLPLGAMTVLGHAVAAAEASSLDRVVLVLGSAADEALHRREIHRAEVAYNEHYRSGCASSLLAGLEHLADVDAILLLLGDMPLLPTAAIDTVVSALRTSAPWGAVTEYDNGVIGHPFAFSRMAFPTLRSLHGDKAVWKLVDDDSTGRIARIEVGGALPRDIDTWEDYAEVCASAGVTPPPGLAPSDT